ncbi:MAG: KAP family NTPase [Lactobacillales bacterium]|jgi:hypothetical protein|nr:KAP family NTPase [Lactobacillales bacterium]
MNKKISWEDDCLNIGENVNGISQIIDKTEGSKVFGIASPFGTGKTFFAGKLSQTLEQKDHFCIKYNAWESDYYENPLLPLMFEIFIALESQKNVVGEYLSKAKTAFGALMKSLDVVFNMETFENNLKEGGAFYSNYNSLLTNKAKIKDELEGIVKSLNKKIVIIVDDLDRCRPDYAVSTLECVKHFFQIPGVHFVILYDKEQLESSVRHIFGTRDFDGYIRKFIDYHFYLPTPDPLYFVQHLYFPNSEQKYELSKILNSDSVKFIGNYGYSRPQILTVDLPETEKKLLKYNCYPCEVIIVSAAAFFASAGFSLRRQEQTFDRFTLFIKSLSEKIPLYPELALFLSFIFEFDQKLFTRYRSGETPNSKILDDISAYIKNQKIECSPINSIASEWYQKGLGVWDTNGKGSYSAESVFLFLGADDSNKNRMTFVLDEKFDSKIIQSYFSHMTFINNLIEDKTNNSS